MQSFLIQIAFIAALPVLFVGGAAALSWQQLSKPWLFIMLALVVLYVTYFAIFYFWPSQVIGYTLITGQTTDGAKNYDVASHNGQVDPLFIGQYLWQLLLFSILAIPALWLLVKSFPGKAV
jgi:hypothetical protein